MVNNGQKMTSFKTEELLSQWHFWASTGGFWSLRNSPMQKGHFCIENGSGKRVRRDYRQVPPNLLGQYLWTMRILNVVVFVTTKA